MATVMDTGQLFDAEFARNITAVIYKMADKPYRAIKVSKNEWQLPEVQAGEVVTVSMRCIVMICRCGRRMSMAPEFTVILPR